MEEEENSATPKSIQKGVAGMGRTIAYYEKLLKNPQSPHLPVSSLANYINAITAIKGMYRNVLFRGQANAKWKLESSAYRELLKHEEHPTPKMLEEHHHGLLRKVSTLNDTDNMRDVKELGEFALLAHLQHLGAKTSLLDFTSNPLVALWFACMPQETKKKKQADGCVYCVRCSGASGNVIPLNGEKSIEQLFVLDDSIHMLTPINTNRRIPAQQSVFLFRTSGYIDDDRQIAIQIAAGFKKKLLESLSAFGINKKSLFHDLPGFFEWVLESDYKEEKYDELIAKAKKQHSALQYSQALDLFQEAYALGESLFQTDSLELSSLHVQIGDVYYAKGEYKTALEEYKKALAIFEKMLGKGHPDTAITYDNIGGVYSSLGEYDKALEWYNKALAIYEKVGAKEHPGTATTYNNIGLVYDNRGKYDKALEWYQKALRIAEKVLGANHPSTANSYNNIGLVYKELGEYEKALEWYHKALAIREKVLGANHPSTANSYNNIGAVYENMGEYGKALEWHSKALDIREKVLGKEHPHTATTYNNIGRVYDKQGKYTEALELLQKALAIREKVLGKEHPFTAMTYNNIGVVYDNMGEYERALEWYNKALAIREKKLGKEHSFTAKTYNNIGVVYDNMDEYEKALEWYHKALAIREQVLGDDHPYTKSTRDNIERVRKAMRRGEGG
jgi:tetratricopeptide (TPR) repeat protein